MAWSDAISSVLKLFGIFIEKLLGEQTLEEHSTEKQAEKLASKQEKALLDGELDLANTYRNKLKRLRDKSLSKRAGRS